MNKGVVIFIFLLLIPIVYSISIKELISRYSFSTVTFQMNVTNFTDFMIDKNNNGINDTLIFELTTNNTNGTFIFIINLFDKNGILTNETNKTLIVGINKLNLTFSSILLSQNQYNYSIKVYNSTRRLKYRKDNILTQTYLNYEEGFKILSITDSNVNKTLRINVTINSPENKTHTTTLFLNYNNSIIFSKEQKSVKSGTNHLLFNFDNETIKRTHYIGNFTISSLKIGRKTLKINTTTAFYDFKDFAVTPYIFNFTDNGTDTNSNNKYDMLQINISAQIINNNNHTITLTLYDLFDNIIEAKNISLLLNSGKNIITFNINGSKIYDKKLNGPFLVKNAELYENGTLVDKINDAYITSSYNFNDFDSPGLPDLIVNISISDDYRYGINNVTINFTFKNIGNKHAFNIFTDIFDNKTFSSSNKSNILDVGSQLVYQFNFTNFSDFEISAIADLQNFIEELNESNNAERVTVKLNKKPVFSLINNITVKETEKIVINLSASDPNEDNLSYSVNLSKFLIISNVLGWNTTTLDSGNYILKAEVSDGFLNDTAIFKVIILDNLEKDFDNDGIDDSIDKLIGNENSVNASSINLSIFVGNSRNLSKLFNESIKVRFMDNNLTIAEFDFDFLKYKLNLTNVTLNKQLSNATGSLFVRGLKMPEGATKILYVDRINATINGICIKEEEISSLNEISNNCGSNNEFKIECDETLQESYFCTYNSTSNKYKIQGLKHSGIVQISYKKPIPSSSSSTSAVSSSSGGGGGFVCISDWQCSEWTLCVNGFINRKCNDTNQCAFPSKKPNELEECEIEIKIVEVIKPLDYISKSIKQIKQKIQKFETVTGQAVKSSEKINFGIFIIFIEVIIIIGTYLAIKNRFFKNI